MPGITVGSRVSQEAGETLASGAHDDGASQLPGTGANARRRKAQRKRIFGTVISSVDRGQWKVRWDEPNYKADSNGVWETVEYFNKIRRELAGAGTGPGSPNARPRYVPHRAVEIFSRVRLFMSLTLSRSSVLNCQGAAER